MCVQKIRKTKYTHIRERTKECRIGRQVAVLAVVVVVAAIVDEESECDCMLLLNMTHANRNQKRCVSIRHAAWSL